MPFKKRGSRYISESGREMTYEQVQAYYAQNPKSKKSKHVWVWIVSKQEGEEFKEVGRFTTCDDAINSIDGEKKVDRKPNAVEVTTATDFYRITVQ